FGDGSSRLVSLRQSHRAKYSLSARLGGKIPNKHWAFAHKALHRGTSAETQNSLSAAVFL
ncbi:MAG: hypothetical protein WAL40_15380, partial [Rhodoplanes sp.]